MVGVNFLPEDFGDLNLFFSKFESLLLTELELSELGLSFWGV